MKEQWEEIEEKMSYIKENFRFRVLSVWMEPNNSFTLLDTMTNTDKMRTCFQTLSLNPIPLVQESVSSGGLFAENCMKMKEFGPPGWGTRPSCPP